MPTNDLTRFISTLAVGLCLLANSIVTLHAAGMAPEAPSNLTGSIIDGAVSLSWDIPQDDDSIQGYNIYINNQYTNTVLTNEFSTVLEPDTLYSFVVVAFDEEPRLFSPSSEALTLPESLVPDDLTIPPSVPAGLTGDVSGTSVMLSWEPSTDDEAVLGYNVYRDNQYFTTVGSPSYTGENEEGVSHSWYVVAFDIRTNFSTRSERITLPDPGPVDTTIAPSVPTALAGSVSTDDGNTDTVSVTWQASTDDQSVAGYNIYRNRQYIATRFTTEYIGEVEAGSSNNFQVVAFDFDGNFSSSSEALTLPDGSGEADPGVPPSVPQGLAGDTTTANGQTQVSLEWEPSSGPVNVVGYNVYRNNQYLTTVFTNAYTDTVASGVAFSYSVVAFDDFGNFSSRSAPLNLLGDSNQPPFFSDLDDQQLTVGEAWELVLRPVDIDGGAAGILVSSQPAGAELIDNGDGSRSLTWTPTTDDVGSYEITITAFDLEDTELRTSQTITLTVGDDDMPVDVPFSLSISQAAYNLQEGNVAGVDIPVTLRRSDAFESPVTLSVSADNEAGISTAFSTDSFDAAQTQTSLNLQLAISVLPIASEQRRFTVTASDGTFEASSSVTVAVTPVARDDVYLLLGQSNMVGLSEEGAKQAFPGGLDELDLRIRQANVQANDIEFYPTPASFTDVGLNFEEPVIVTAEDPLHEPVDESTLSKEGTRIGMSVSFAKAALPATTRNIVLVPAAWSGSGFCNTTDPAVHWNALPTDNPALGNTLLFERALKRIDQVLLDTGGILRGILWHQGESDAEAECAPSYEQNLVTLVSELRSRISEDARGSDARGPLANIPFVAGTMSKGSDERGDLSNFPPDKLIVDSVHRNIANLVPHSEVVLTDDLVPANGFRCGEGSCIHFGADALREMGVRAYDALLRAAGN